MMRCPLCGRPGASPYLRTRSGSAFHQCPSCRYVFRDPGEHPDAEAAKHRYGLHRNDPGEPGYRRWLERFLDFALAIPPPQDGRVLDFGSGPVPALATLMAERGYQVETEDLHFSPRRPPGFFDLITALEVFEHLSDPGRVLKDLAGRLKPGGRLCISTEFRPPDAGEFAGWHYLSDPTHIGFFDRDGLVRHALTVSLAEDGGDEVRYVSFRLVHPGSAC